MEEDKRLKTKFDLSSEGSTKTQIFPLTKIILAITIAIAIILIIVVIIITVSYENKLSEQSKDTTQNTDADSTTPQTNDDGPDFDEYVFFGGIKYNLTYDVDGIIENSFKVGGENHNESIGNLNDGRNYEKNDRNKYNLYIPQYALDRKNETNGIMLWVHGGSWVEGDLTEMDVFCKSAMQLGYISATMGYTVLNGYVYKDYNIFRILDEITACIKAIKKKLKEYEFNEDKLIMGIGGYSAGAHISLLYSYLINTTNIIPFKFLINFVGPIGLCLDYFYAIRNPNNTLSSIDDLNIIKEAKNNYTIVPMFNESKAVEYMNLFYGNKYSGEQLKAMTFENETINYENEDFQKLYRIIRNSFITDIVDKNKLPTLCIYAGLDYTIGVTVFAYLKDKMIKDGRHYDFIYSRYEGHMLIYPHDEEGIKRIREANSKINYYFKEYFGY